MTKENFPDLHRRGQITYVTMPDGMKLRTASWPSEEDSRGIIVLVNGYREYMEKYAEFISDFLKRGFALYSLDHRGQGLSSRLLPDKMKCHATNFDFFISDLHEVILTNVMSDARAKILPIYLVGHSMGGHICLRYLHDFPGGIDKAVVMAPMIDMNLGRGVARNFLKFIIRFFSRIGLREAFSFGQKTGFPKERHFIKEQLLTHDKERYAVEAQVIEKTPGLYVGGATFGWLDSALDSIQKIQKADFMAPISVPLLAVLAGDDQVVDSQASRAILSDQEGVTLVTIKDARHEIYRESDLYRDQLWQKMAKFLNF